MARQWQCRVYRLRLDPEIANSFAFLAAKKQRGNAQVYPLWYRADNPAEINLRGDELMHNIAGTLADAWDRGHDAVRLNNFAIPGGHKGRMLIVKDESQLRSPWAKFDPARKYATDLLAGLAGTGALAPNLLPIPPQQAPVF